MKNNNSEKKNMKEREINNRRKENGKKTGR